MKAKIILKGEIEIEFESIDEAYIKVEELEEKTVLNALTFEIQPCDDEQTDSDEDERRKEYESSCWVRR